MTEKLLPFLRCPVSRTCLQLQVISNTSKVYDGINAPIVLEGFLFGGDGWFYPVINGVPRLSIEAFLFYEDFCQRHLSDYNSRKERLLAAFPGIIGHVRKKNKKTRASFSLEWNLYEYGKDKTWDAGDGAMLERFLRETDETAAELKNKTVFDAGCGNGVLDQMIAEKGATVLAMDLSNSIERAFAENKSANAFFIEGDIQFPPVAFEYFDIVHCSGVLIHTNNTELSFSCLDACAKKNGKLSVWLYHPRKGFIHNCFNLVRGFTSRLPLRIQYYLYLFTLFPVSFVIKRLKSNRQNRREMMIDILDWFSPEFRWEHTPDEAASWFHKRKYGQVKETTRGMFGFNIIGTKL